MTTKRSLLAMRGRLYPAGSRTLSDSQRVAGRALCGERDAVANAERHAASSVGDSPGQPDLCCRSSLIYVRGIEPKPWLGQGIRFGILLAMVTAVPQSMVEFFTYPIPAALAVDWIIGEGLLALLLGVIVAAICRPQTTP